MLEIRAIKIGLIENLQTFLLSMSIMLKGNLSPKSPNKAGKIIKNEKLLKRKIPL